MLTETQVGQCETLLMLVVSSGVAKSSVRDGEKGKVSSHDRRESEEQNNESQKQKVSPLFCPSHIQHVEV